MRWLAAILVLSALFVLYRGWSTGEHASGSLEVPDQAATTGDRAHAETPVAPATETIASSPFPVNWTPCGDDLRDPACFELLEEVFPEIEAEGQPWSDRFATLEEDIRRVQRLGSEPECTIRSWRPDLADRCGAESFAAVAFLLSSCPSGRQPPLDPTVLEFRNQDGLVTDLEVTRRAEQSHRLAQLENAWLTQRCERLLGPEASASGAAPGEGLTPNDLLSSYQGSDARAEFLIRATLLGHSSSANHYLEARKRLFRPVDSEIRELIDDASRPAREVEDEARALIRDRYRLWESETAEIVARVMERDPATGFVLRAQLEFERYPELDAAYRYISTESGADARYPVMHLDDPELVARAEDVLVYRLAALELGGFELSDLDDTSLESLRRTDAQLRTVARFTSDSSLHTLVGRAAALASSPMAGTASP